MKFKLNKFKILYQPMIFHFEAKKHKNHNKIKYQEEKNYLDNEGKDSIA